MKNKVSHHIKRFGQYIKSNSDEWILDLLISLYIAVISTYIVSIVAFIISKNFATLSNFMANLIESLVFVIPLPIYFFLTFLNRYITELTNSKFPKLASYRVIKSLKHQFTNFASWFFTPDTSDSSTSNSNIFENSFQAILFSSSIISASFLITSLLLSNIVSSEDFIDIISIIITIFIHKKLWTILITKFNSDIEPNSPHMLASSVVACIILSIASHNINIDSESLQLLATNSTFNRVFKNFIAFLIGRFVFFDTSLNTIKNDMKSIWAHIFSIVFSILYIEIIFKFLHLLQSELFPIKLILNLSKSNSYSDDDLNTIVLLLIVLFIVNIILPILYVLPPLLMKLSKSNQRTVK